MLSKQNTLKAMVFLVIFLTAIFHFNVFFTNPAQALKVFQFTSSGHVLEFQKNNVYITIGSYKLRETFVDSNVIAPQVNQNSGNREGLKTLEKVTYSNLWEGVTLVYDNPSNGILRSTFHIGPGVDPNLISLKYNVPVILDKEGNLVYLFENGNMTASAPIAWQEIDGNHVPINVSFKIKSSESTIHFLLGDYDTRFPLFIDPTLKWNTFMGSNFYDYGHAITLDDNGNIYIVGSSYDSWGSPVNDFSGWEDAFAAKLSKSGELQWNTFMGSAWVDEASAVAIDKNGNIFVAGTSNTAGWGLPINDFAGLADGFVAKLNNNGVLQWHTFMGSMDSDVCAGIDIDALGNIYVVGFSETDWGSPVNPHAGGLGYDAFVVKLNNSGETEWNTFIGSTETDWGRGIAVNESGNIYVAGSSQTSWGNPLSPHSGDGYPDAFVAKLADSGGTQWVTFLGSSETDYGRAVVAKESNILCVSGYSSNTWGNPVYTHTGGYDAFAAKLNSNGGIIWNTFLGSTLDDIVGFTNGNIDMDMIGNIYLIGWSNGSWGKPKNDFTGQWDVFVGKLNGNGRLLWNTFLGSSFDDHGNGIVVDDRGGIYVVGSSETGWGNPLHPYKDDYDIFLAKIFNGILTPKTTFLLLNSSDE